MKAMEHVVNQLTLSLRLIAFIYQELVCMKNQQDRVVSITCVLILLALSAFLVMPRVEVHYTKEGAEPLNFIISNDYYANSGVLEPGEFTVGYGDLIFNDDYPIMLNWWITASQMNCIIIKPDWPKTRLHIGPDGRIDEGQGGATHESVGPCWFSSRE